MLNVNFTPFPVLSSDRLHFRAITPADLGQLYRLRSDEVSVKYLDKDPLKNQEEAQTLLNTMLENVRTNDGILWAITLKEDTALMIGTICYWRFMKEDYRAELGYMLLPEYFNKGYMTEAIHTVNRYGFEVLGLHSVEAHINPANEASAAILLKTGFVKEAHFRQNFHYKGKFLDTVIYCILNPAG